MGHTRCLAEADPRFEGYGNQAEKILRATPAYNDLAGGDSWLNKEGDFMWAWTVVASGNFFRVFIKKLKLLLKI